MRERGREGARRAVIELSSERTGLSRLEDVLFEALLVQRRIDLALLFAKSLLLDRGGRAALAAPPDAQAAGALHKGKEALLTLSPYSRRDTIITLQLRVNLEVFTTLSSGLRRGFRSSSRSFTNPRPRAIASFVRKQRCVKYTNFFRGKQWLQRRWFELHWACVRA